MIFKYLFLRLSQKLQKNKRLTGDLFATLRCFSQKHW